jgi:hypothetical protein
VVRFLVRITASPPPTETALIAPVAEAEPLVGAFRERLDPAAGWGIPPHVTVLYPFVPPAEVRPRVHASVAAAIGGIPAFVCRFARTNWFGDEVLWLAPEPAEPFRLLTDAVWSAFPGHPPYGGAHPDVVPHLTVGQRPAAGAAGQRPAAGAIGQRPAADAPALRDAERAIRDALPFTAGIERVLLVAGSDAAHSWHTLAEYRLGAPTGS